MREISLPINRDARVVEELWRGFDAQVSETLHRDPLLMLTQLRQRNPLIFLEACVQSFSSHLPRFGVHPRHSLATESMGMSWDFINGDANECTWDLSSSGGGGL